jgi:hypothetical protein
MATKKAVAKPGRPPSKAGPRTLVLGIRGRKVKNWLARFADANRSDMVDLIDGCHSVEQGVTFLRHALGQHWRNREFADR